MRAVTFQSMLRISSPGAYSRTSSNSIPLPLKTLLYSPASTESTALSVWISINRIFLATLRVKSLNSMDLRALQKHSAHSQR